MHPRCILQLLRFRNRYMPIDPYQTLHFFSPLKLETAASIWTQLFNTVLMGSVTLINTILVGFVTSINTVLVESVTYSIANPLCVKRNRIMQNLHMSDILRNCTPSLAEVKHTHQTYSNRVYRYLIIESAYGICQSALCYFT